MAPLAHFLLAAAAVAPTPNVNFPPNFEWCVATAAHQIEGDNVASDWWAFEHEAGRIARGETSGAAADHWNRVAEDVALLQRLGVTTYRMSVEWAKIEPEPGTYSESALQHYAEEVHLLRAAGIKPLITLHHFTLPLWAAARGGWQWDGIVPAFLAYSARVYDRLGAEVTDWVTLNEPMVAIYSGYVEGRWPPAKTDMKLIAQPLTNMVRAHAVVVASLRQRAHSAGRAVRFGVANNLRVFDPAHTWNPADRFLVHLLDDLYNWSFIDVMATGRLRLQLPFILDIDVAIPEAKGTMDFVGVNYYSRDLVRFTLQPPLFMKLEMPKDATKTDMGWEIYPEGFYRLIKRVAERYPETPIIITENGLADARDAQRAGFLRAHLRALQRAIAEGAKVEGYCHWSLMDNFEWADGFAPRFGLYEVDYDTFERRLRASGELYRRIVQANRVVDES